MSPRYLVDTNILLRIAYPALAQHSACKAAVDRLVSDGGGLSFCLQNAAEFWNVSTRPERNNGLALSPDVARLEWREVEQTMTFLPDTETVYKTWRTLVETYQIRGVQVHDARLVAAMLVHNVPHVLTFNTADFSRYTGIEAVHPAEV